MNTSKYLIICLFLLSITQASYAQFPISLNLSVIPPYSVKLEDYTEYEINAILTINNTTNNTYLLSFDATLIGDNGIIVNSLNSPPVLAIEPFGVRTLTGQQFDILYNGFTIDDFLITGISTSLREEIIKNRALPEGNYQFCLTAKDASDGTILSVPFGGCANFQIQYPDRPYIINPGLGQVIPETESREIDFYWSAPGSAGLIQSFDTEYELRVIDMTNYTDIDPTEAMMDPTVDFVYSELGIETEFKTADIPDLEVGHEYAVRVTASDVEGNIPYAFDGHSEVVVFTYGEEESQEENFDTPPKIITPVNNSTLHAANAPQFTWQLPKKNGSVIAVANPELNFLDLNKHNLNSISNNDEFESHHLLYQSIGWGENREQWTIGDTESAIIQGGDIEFIHGHRYALRLQCIDDGTEDVLVSEIVHFIYTEYSPPEIILPEDNGIVNITNSPQFRWTLPEKNGSVIAVANPTLNFINETKHNLTSITSNEEFEEKHLLQQSIGWSTNRTEWTIGNTEGAVKQGGDIEFIHGHKYALQLECIDEDNDNTILSEIIHFSYSDESQDDDGITTDCSAGVNFSFDPYFPITGDTIPFLQFPVVAQYDPVCRDVNRLGFDLQLQEENNSSNYYSRTNAMNRWPKGPVQYLKDIGISDAGPLRASLLPLNMQSVQDTETASGNLNIDQGKTYTYEVPTPKARMRYSSPSLEKWYEGGFDIVSFNVGMPMPKMESPAHAAKILPGKINLKWHTGDIPEKLITPVALVHAEHSNITEKTYFSKVDERYIIQVSKEEEFTNSNIIFGAQGHLLYDAHVTGANSHPTNSTYYYDSDALSAAIYKNVDHQTDEITEEGDYFWRILWLNTETVQEDVSDPKDAALSNQAYRISPTRMFFIDADASSDPDTPSEEIVNEKTDCSTDCEKQGIVMTPSNTISDISSFKAGYFVISELQISNNSNGRLTGSGIAKIDFMNNVLIKVEFNNISLNATGELVEGTVNAKKEDTPFNLNDINNEIASGAQTLGVDGQVNTWLEDNADEGRIVSGFVSDRAIGMPIGIERDIKEHKLLIGITDLTFNPQGATVKILYEQHFEKMRSDQWLSIAGEVCIKPSGFGAEVLLHMNRDLVIEDYWEEDEDARDIKYIIKGSNSSDPTEIRNNSTHIEFQCACVESFALRMEAEFDEDKLVKDTDSGDPGIGPVKAYFNFELKRERACQNEEDREELSEIVADKMRTNNFMVDFTMDPFQIKGLEGWGFHVTEGYLDFSSLENPEGMIFPAGYEHAAALTPPEGTNGVDATALQNIWNGFYLKEISIKAPTDFYENNADRRLNAGVQNLLIDNTGFSGEIFADNLVAFGDGEVDNCSFSIDSFRLRIIQNVFREGELEGKFGIPITDEETDYEAVLAYTVPDNDNASDDSTEGSSAPGYISSGSEDDAPDSEWGFFMGIKPKGNLNTPAFMGSINLNDNSYVHLKYGEVPESFVNDDNYDEERKGIALYFDGVMDFSTVGGSESTLRTDTAKVNTPFSFKGMQFDLEYNNKDGFDWNYSFASPQKYIGGSVSNEEDAEGVSGFPLTIRELNVESEFDELASQCIGARLNFQIALNLMDDDDGGFEASADLHIGAKFDFDRNRFLFDGLGVTCISIGAKTSGEEGTENSGVSFKGQVCFYNDEPYCGVNNVTGIAGQLTVGLPIATVELGAMFASTDGFRFWYVDGKAVSNSGPLVTLGPIDIIGLSGGIYYNMALRHAGSSNGQEYNSALVSAAGDLHNSSPSSGGCTTVSGFEIFPSEGSYIFKVGAAIATTGDASVFNMDIGVTAAISRGRGLTYFDIIGDGYVMADIDEREKAPIKADVKILFDKQIERKIFDAQFAVYLDLEAGPLTLKGVTPDMEAFDYPVTRKKRSQFVRASFRLEQPEIGENMWAFKLGSPQQPGGLNADILGFLRINIFTYFQIGKDVDTGFMELPQLIKDMLFPSEGDGTNGLESGQTLTSADRSYGGPPTSGRADGFILGLSATTEIDISVFIIYAHLELALGFDVNVVKYGDNNVCYTKEGEVIEPIGSNGWYGSGQLYAGVLGEVGLQIWFFGHRRFHLFKLGAAFQIQGGFPNPVWAEGRAAIMYSVLGGLVEGTTRISFTVGEKCVPPRTDPFGFSIIAATDPENGAKNISPFVRPKVSFAIPIEEIFEIPIVEDVLDDNGEVVDSRVRVEKLKPIIESLEIKDRRNGAHVNMETRKWSLNDDNTILTANINDPIENKDLSLYIKLGALELNKYGEWDRVLWPSHAQKEGYWSEDTTVVFSTGELPEQIPPETLKDANPFPRQRYYMKEAILSKNGKIDFFRNLQSTYFRDIVDNKQVEYFVKFYDMDGSDPLISLIRKLGKSILFDIPPALQNDMIYNFVLVRKIKNVESPEVFILDGPLNFDGIFPAQPNELTMQQGNVILQYSQIFDDALFAGLNNKTNFISRTRKLVPGESEINPDETVLYKFPFKTSQFNSLQAKLENAETVLAWKETGSGEFVSTDPWVEITTEEGFDDFDLIGITRKFYEQESYTRSPLVAFFPELDNYYWKNKAEPSYASMLSFMKYGFYNYQGLRDHPEAGHYRILSDIRKPRISFMGDHTINFNHGNLQGIFNSNEMQMKFHQLNIDKPKISRFAIIDNRTVRMPLHDSEVQFAWDNTVNQMAEEMYPENNDNANDNTIASNDDQIFLTGISIPPNNSIIGNESQSSLPSINSSHSADFRPRTRFLFDLNRKVERDMEAFKSRMINMHYFTTSFDYFRPGSSTGSIIQVGNIQREHLKDQFSNYDAMLWYWYNQQSNWYSLENNPGNYKFNVNYYLGDFNGYSIPAWGSPEIKLNFSN